MPFGVREGRGQACAGTEQCVYYEPQPEKKLHEPIKSNKCVGEPAALHVTRWLKQQKQHVTSCTNTFAKNVGLQDEYKK